MRKIFFLAIVFTSNFAVVDAVQFETDRLILVQARSNEQLTENQEIYKLLPEETTFESYIEIYSKIINFYNDYEAKHEKDIFFGDYYIYLKKDASLIGLCSLYPPSLYDDHTKGYSPIFIYLIDEYKKNGYEDEIIKVIISNIQKNFNIDYSELLNDFMQDMRKDANQIANSCNKENDIIMQDLIENADGLNKPIGFYNKQNGTLNGVFYKNKMNDYEGLKTVLSFGFVPGKMDNSYFNIDVDSIEIFSFFPPKKKNDLSTLEIEQLEQLTWQLSDIDQPNDISNDLHDIDEHKQLLSTLMESKKEISKEITTLKQKIAHLKQVASFNSQQGVLSVLEKNLANKTEEYDNYNQLIFDVESTTLNIIVQNQAEIIEKIKILIFNQI